MFLPDLRQSAADLRHQRSMPIDFDVARTCAKPRPRLYSCTSKKRSTMYFCHTHEIWQQFPQLVPGVLVADGLHPQVDVEEQLRPWYERARERLGQAAESELPEVAAWRRAYARMGMKPTQYRSAAEALMRRFRREDTLPRLHPLVDLCNAVSLAFALPIAVFDRDKIARYLEVRYATGVEEYLAFSGEIEAP